MTFEDLSSKLPMFQALILLESIQRRFTPRQNTSLLLVGLVENSPVTFFNQPLKRLEFQRSINVG